MTLNKSNLKLHGIISTHILPKRNTMTFGPNFLNVVYYGYTRVIYGIFTDSFGT